MKKILVVGDFISGSGLTNVIFNVFSRFPEQYKVSAVGYGIDPNNYTTKKCQQLGWNFYRVTPVTKNPLKHWLWWRSFFKKHHFDVVYFNYSSSWNYLPLIAAKKIGQTPLVVAHSHNTYFSHLFNNNFLNKLLLILNNHGKRQFCKYSDVKIATSKEAACWMFGQEETANVHISLNGIDFHHFSYSEEWRCQMRRKYGVSDSTFLVGFVGVLQERKNPLFALECFEKFHAQNPNSKMVMLGKGPLKEQIQAEIQHAQLVKDVIMIDFSTKVNQWYSAMDVLYFPSMHEGLPLVTIEAQISNLPILASSTNPDLIFATPRIKRMSDLAVKEWVKSSLLICSQPKNRVHFDHRLDRFSIDSQTEKIVKLLEKN